MREFKTPKGTELPLVDIKGKDYLQVAHRIMWFREEHPDWPIKIEVVDKTEKYVTCKATVLNDKGVIIQEAHKTEHFSHFQDALEKAETGAIGRALANLGYGTAFAQDLLEHEGPIQLKPKLVDSPQNKKNERNEASRLESSPETHDDSHQSPQNGEKAISMKDPPNTSFHWTESAMGKVQFMMKKSGWSNTDLGQYLKSKDTKLVSEIKLQKDFDELLHYMEKHPIVKKEKPKASQPEGKLF